MDLAHKNKGVRVALEEIASGRIVEPKRFTCLLISI